MKHPPAHLQPGFTVVSRAIFCAIAFASIVTTSPAFSQSAPQNAAGADVHDAQNPVSSVISVPFQNNTFFAEGPYRRTGDVLIVEPVIPFKLNDEWNLITRWVVPMAYEPRISPTEDSKVGLGNLEPEFYFSPNHTGEIIWGVGPKLWLPTASDKTFGPDKWGGGPAAVALTFQGPWVMGVIANNVWAGSHNHRVNEMTLNPFAYYNMPNGWYVISSPVITADWLAEGKKWTLPLGGGVGRLFAIDDQPVNARFQVLDNVVRPQYAPTWQLQFQVQFLFPAK